MFFFVAVLERDLNLVESDRSHQGFRKLVVLLPTFNGECDVQGAHRGQPALNKIDGPASHVGKALANVDVDLGVGVVQTVRAVGDERDAGSVLAGQRSRPRLQERG